MKWKRARSDTAQICSARGCQIAAGSEYWAKRWRTESSAAPIESAYCLKCGDASRCATGIVKIGPAVIVTLAILSFVVLPIVWPGRLLAYPAIFVGAFVLTAFSLARSFLWLFRHSPQVRRSNTWNWPAPPLSQTASATPARHQPEASAGPSDP